MKTSKTVAGEVLRSVRVGVYGASGTSGAELVRLLDGHPAVDLRFGTSRSHAGVSLSTIEPEAPPLELRHPKQVYPTEIDLAFLCLPHGASAETAEQCLSRGNRVIDLSGDLRLRDPKNHHEVYGTPRSEVIASQAVYGLTELVRGRLREAKLVSNPGCYATAATLALAPFLEADVVRRPPIIDAKSGISGAGRSATNTTHFLAVHGELRPYKIGRAHRHVPEIEQTLSWLHPYQEAQKVIFTPQVIPTERGIIETITLLDSGRSASELRRILADRYLTEPFIEVLPAGDVARLRAVVRTNRVQLSLHDVEGLDAVVLTSALDNLVKGAAGQAIQNMNTMFALEETMGLDGARRFGGFHGSERHGVTQ